MSTPTDKTPKIVSLMLEGKYRVLQQEIFHTKNPEGKRTIRRKYLDNLPLRHGAWYANTETEQVVEGPKHKLKTVIPEHRVA